MPICFLLEKLIDITIIIIILWDRFTFRRHVYNLFDGRMLETESDVTSVCVTRLDFTLSLGNTVSGVRVLEIVATGIICII